MWNSSKTRFQAWAWTFAVWVMTPSRSKRQAVIWGGRPNAGAMLSNVRGRDCEEGLIVGGVGKYQCKFTLQWWTKRTEFRTLLVSEHVLAGGTPALVAAGEARQMVVHVDVGVLTGESHDGLCNLENGVRLSTAEARRIGCDAEIIPVIERYGLPIDG